MRRRITTMLIGGERMAVVKYKPFFSERFAVLITSENPNHAQNSIRKTLAHQRRKHNAECRCK